MVASSAWPSWNPLCTVSRDASIVVSSSRICADIWLSSCTTLPEPEVPVSAPVACSSEASLPKRSPARWMSGSSDRAPSALVCAWSRSAV